MFLGIDVSKKTLDAALLKEGSKVRHKIFDNDTAGHTALLQWLEEQGMDHVHACLEATGTWAEAVALALYQVGHVVSLVNPARTHAFAKSQLTRTKTDKADAILIAQFGQMYQPPAWVPPAPEVQQLQGLIRRLEALAEMRKMEENRLTSGGLCAPVQDSIQEHITYLEHQTEKTQRQVSDHIDQHPQLKKQAQLLQSIPGIGAATAAVLLAELGDMARSFITHGKWRLLPVWCLASASQAVPCVAPKNSLKWVRHVCAKLSIFQPSRRCASIHWSKPKDFAYQLVAKTRC